MLGGLLAGPRLRALPRPTFPGSRLGATDLRPTDEEPGFTRFARSRLARRYSGHLSDKHLSSYLDELAFESCFRRPLDAFALLVDALPLVRPITYRTIVGRGPLRPRLELVLQGAAIRRALSFMDCG